MKNQYIQFYKKALNNPTSINWADFAHDFVRIRNRRDFEIALMRGSSLDHTNESNMLERWNWPWLFFRVFLFGCILCGLTIFAKTFSTHIANGYVTALDIILFVIGPMIVPITIMVFFWELNIPANFSLLQLLACFGVGSVICFFVTSLMFPIIPENLGSVFGAPIREEIAKAITSLIILYILSKHLNMRIYGITGLIIGAAVGTGFSVFESIDYGLRFGLDTVTTRFFCAPTGHTLYAAPYSAAMALHIKNSKLTKETLFNQDFLFTFVGAVLTHMFWNSGILERLFIVKLTVSIIVTWYIALFITRKCIHQIVESAVARNKHNKQMTIAKGNYVEGYVIGTRGYYSGRLYHVTNTGVRFGRNPSCQISFTTDKAIGISSDHCLLQYDQQRKIFVLYDLGSTYGTFLANGKRLKPQVPETLFSGDEFFLGGGETSFKVGVK